MVIIQIERFLLSHINHVSDTGLHNRRPVVFSFVTTKCTQICISMEIESLLSIMRWRHETLDGSINHTLTRSVNLSRGDWGCDKAPLKVPF